MGLRGFFRSFMSSSKQPFSPPAVPPSAVSTELPDFDSYSLQDILLLSNQTNEAINTRTMSMLVSRLLDIIYTERDLSEEDQEKAIIIYEALVKDVEAGLDPYPDGLAKFNEAHEYQIDHLKNVGRWSLSWKVAVPGMSEDEILSIMVDPANGDLIPRFINTIDDIWTDLKPKVIKRLILDRYREGETNAVFILAGLVNLSDTTAKNVLNINEKLALLNASIDYKSARQVLVNYKLLADISMALPFEPRENAANVALLVTHSLKDDEEESPWNRTALAAHPDFDSEQRNGINTALFAIRMFVWCETLEGLYGESYKEQVQDNLKTLFINSWNEGLASILAIIKNSKMKSAAETATLGWDTSIAADLLAIYLPESDSLSKEAKIALVMKTSSIFNAEHVYWMSKARFLLRFFVNDIEKKRDIFRLSNNEKDLYLWLGSFAGNIEAKSLYEDWIGTNKHFSTQD